MTEQDFRFPCGETTRSPISLFSRCFSNCKDQSKVTAILSRTSQQHLCFQNLSITMRNVFRGLDHGGVVLDRGKWCVYILGLARDAPTKSSYISTGGSEKLEDEYTKFFVGSVNRDRVVKNCDLYIEPIIWLRR